jgi:Holliday junction resolvase RusA-like endonuclease
MKPIRCMVKGVPYCRTKNRGRTEAPAKWTKKVIKATGRLPKVMQPCAVSVTFLLPPDKFPKNLPYGPDLDNLTKRFLDALGKTIFGRARGGDSCVVELRVRKCKVRVEAKAGALLRVRPAAKPQPRFTRR